ncbi:MAG TPA: T9SS type A sorting domain-containing protein [Paludibacter sp.]|nr:T9SS type A sorting domain-containing protein [Paludibacter sp.]
MKRNFLLRYLLSAVALIFTCCGMYGHPFAGGSGTLRDPYLVQTVAQFDSLRRYRSSNFRLEADLDFNGYTRSDGLGWYPVGQYGSGENSAERFSGIFDGNHHTIRNINTVRDAWDLSIFGVVDGGTIKNLVVRDCYIDGLGRLGALSGATYDATISQVAIINTTVMYHGTSGSNAGGITGALTRSTVQDCYVMDGFVYGADAVGGISSKVDVGSTVANCWSSAMVETSYTKVGGITGNLNSGTVMNCLAANHKITIVNAGDGRIAGSVLGVLLNNYACDTIRTNGYVMTKDVGTTLKNGENATVTMLADVNFYSNTLGWYFADAEDGSYSQVWKMGTKLPVFVWQNEETQGVNLPLSQSKYTYRMAGGKEMEISNLAAGDLIQVYNLSGVLVASRKATGNTEKIVLKNDGVYVGKIQNNTNSFIFKFIANE